MSIGGFDELLSQTGDLDPEEATASMSIEAGSARRAERQRIEDEKEDREQDQGEPEDVVAEREAITQEDPDREAGDHGGSSGGGSNAASSQTSSVTGPEPRPQRDELDGGDEPVDDDDDEEDVIDNEADTEPEPEPEAEEPVITEPDDDGDTENENEGDEEIVQTTPQGNREGADPAQWKDGAKFSYGVGPVDADGHSTEMKLSRFPKQLVANLRSMIGGHLGDAFAKEAAGNQLVTAFIAARLGIPFEADANTSRMIVAFRELEPQLAELEQTASRTEDQVAALVKTNRSLIKRLGSVEELIASAELGVSFFIADRIAAISTHDMTLEKAEISHPKALSMRDTIRTQSKAEMEREKRRDGVSY